MAKSSSSKPALGGGAIAAANRVVRCAIYTRKSTDEGLQQEFNSLDAQREAAEAYINSQKGEGWQVVAETFDDGGFSGGNMERPALKRLLAAVESRAIDCVVVYKVDRLSRSLMDFARIVEVFDRNLVSFVSVTQQFNTTSSLGRLTLNILLSFAQFEREIISERTRDKMSAARRKGKWIGGHPVLGYDIDPKGGRLIVNPEEAERVRSLFDLYMKSGSLMLTVEAARQQGLVTKRWTTAEGITRGGTAMNKNTLHGILRCALYTGKVDHKGVLYPGEHERIIDQNQWERVQEQLKQNKADSGSRNRNKYGGLLRGLLFCVPCESPMIHTYTINKAKRYRYYVCYQAQREGWKACETKSVPAEAIESAVLSSIRRIGADPSLAEAVALKALEQAADRRRELDRDLDAQRRHLRHLIHQAARAHGHTKEGAPEIANWSEEISATEERIATLAAERSSGPSNHINAEDLRQILLEFDAIWGTLTTKEQEKMIRLLIAKVGYDGRSGKVTINFSSEGAKELCHGKQ
jgi:site-specific DNA recombinase